MAPSEDVVDLTLSDDEAEWPPAERAPKRQRRAGSAWGFQDDLDDVVLVDESELRRERQQQQPAAEEELDEDLVCLESHGDVWNKNLPHTRDTCGEAAFSKQQAVGNAQHCAKCYCWVCDCLASECGDWGDGSTYQHHCHAHAGHAYFAALKQQRKRAATAAAAAAAAGPAAAGPSGGSARDRLMAELAAAEAAQADSLRMQFLTMGRPSGKFGAMCGKPKVPAAAAAAGKPQPCTLTRMPDPAHDRDMLLLARVEVGVKAQGTHTIAQLRKRLERTGFYLSNNPTEVFGDSLCLDNLFESQWDMQTLKNAPKQLKMRKMPLPEQPAEATSLRTRQVTIMHYDGRAPPTTYGVSVQKECTLKELMAAAAPLAGLDSRTEQFVGVSVGGSALSVNFMAETTKVTDRDSRGQSLGLWRVPKPAGKGGEADYAVVFHRRQGGSEFPAWEAVGLPTLLPLGTQFASGGKVAERAMVERLLEALAPLRRQEEGAPARPRPAEEAKQLLKGGTLSLCRTSPYGCSYAVAEEREASFSITRRLNQNLRHGESFYRDGRLYLRVDWTPARLASWGLDTRAWAHPAVDASASPAAMQPTLDLMKTAEEWEAKKRVARQLPSTMLEELKAASRALQPGQAYPVFRRYQTDPMARVVLDLRPDSTDPEEKKGKAVFSVYVWRGERGVAHRPFFQEHDAWDSGKSSRREVHELGAHPLGALMEVMLWGDAENEKMRGA